MKSFFRATKKNLAELLILLVISVCVAPLFSSYFKGRDTIVIGSFSELIAPFVVTFILLSVLYFSNKPKEKSVKIPDGQQVLYNEKGQITREGVFKRGELMEGRAYSYNKNGVVLKTKIYRNGVCTEETESNRTNS